MERMAFILVALRSFFLKHFRVLTHRRLYTLLPSSGENQLSVKFPAGRRVSRGLVTGIIVAVILLFWVIYGTRRMVGSVENPSPHWMKYPILNGYLHGLESIVTSSNYIPEYPNVTNRVLMSSAPSTASDPLSPPQLFRYRPFFDQIEETGSNNESTNPCYLDSAGKIEAPDIYAYSGIPQFQPLPAMGSHNLLHLRDDICFDRYGRYGPYGLGYSIEEGGVGEGMSHRPDPRVADVWKKTGLIDYRNIDWGKAQNRCYESNQHHFVTSNGTVGSGKKKRQAVVIRTYTGFLWTQYAKLNIRALISEAALKSGGEYAVHLLLHVKDDDIPIWADTVARQSVLDEHVPKEFHSVCTLWSEAQMRLYYPGNFGVSVENPSGEGIHSVHRSAHMPLQHFAVHHPEYEHFWNWELDIRYIGSYYELFSRLGDWAARQPRTGAWERSARYYIPALHGSWDVFTENVQRNLQTSGRQPILGPVKFARQQPVNRVMEDYVPESCKDYANLSLCGVDEPADLITLNPLFDVEDSGWVFSKDVTGYDVRSSLPPRRSTLVAASRLSWRLLNIMHQETWKMRHSMFTEMFPPSVALHYGLKSMFAPHPVYLERSWPLETVDREFNGGKDRTAGGPGSPFALANEHNFKGSTWYYHAEFAGRLWRRWLSERKEDDVEKKSADNESPPRHCLRSMLFHPIKWE